MFENLVIPQIGASVHLCLIKVFKAIFIAIVGVPLATRETRRLVFDQRQHLESKVFALIMRYLVPLRKSLITKRFH